MKKIILILLVAAYIGGCIKGSSSHIIKKSFEPLGRNVPVIIYGKEQQLPDSSEYLGKVIARRKWDAPYGYVFTLAEAEARNVGGNALKIRGITMTNSRFDPVEIQAEIYRIHHFENISLDVDNIKKEWKDSGADDFEGIYDLVSDDEDDDIYKVACIKDEFGNYSLVYISGYKGFYNEIWKKGDLKAKLRKTVNKDIFRAYWYRSNKSVLDITFVKFDRGYIRASNEDYRESFVKIFPDSAETNMDISLGTGFIISDEGHIVTCYHGVEKKDLIYIRGINNDFNVKHEAELLFYDKDHDIAVIKPKENIGTITQIPYMFANRQASMGDEIFVLGYPLTTSMGEEIKLTDGIVSSLSGYMGDFTTYQISAPVHAGSSGSPLFDFQGNLLGITNGRLYFAENTSYAVKIEHLVKLLEKHGLDFHIGSENSLSGKSLKEKVKILKDFIYIIETKKMEEDETEWEELKEMNSSS